MKMFRKGYKFKIISVIIGSLFLCCSTLYSYPVSEDSLRVPLYNYERLKKRLPTDNVDKILGKSSSASRGFRRAFSYKYDMGDCEIDDGVFAEVFIPKSEDINFVIKAVRDKDDYEKLKIFLKTYELAKNNLGGLAAKTTLVENVTFVINGRKYYFRAALIQEKITPLKKNFDSLSKPEAKKVLDKIFSLERELYKRGIHNIDHKILTTFGFNAQGKVVFFDFTGMFADKDKFNLYNPENRAFQTIESFNIIAMEEKDLIDYYNRNKINLKKFESLWATRMDLRNRIDDIDLPQRVHPAISIQNLRKSLFNIPFLRNRL